MSAQTGGARRDRPCGGRVGRPGWMAEGGFSIVEVLVSCVIMLVVTAGVFSLLNPAQGTFQAQPEVSDMQQRLRVAIDSMSGDLVMAGAGTYSGAAVGSLGNYFAPILPFRSGVTNPDPPQTFKTDTLTMMFVPTTAAQTTISNAMPESSAELKVNTEPGCPVGDPLCGFYEGMQCIIFDETGAYDQFVVTNVQESAMHLQHNENKLTKEYSANSYITQVASHTYYLKTDDATQTYQLMHYDGNKTDTPIADNVVGLRFDYFGEPEAPRLRKPVTDPKGPWTSYSPKPPALGVTTSNWPAGENCTFMVVNGQQVPRLADLSPGLIGLVPLTQQMLTDGPWCPDSASPTRFDADLFRIRKVRITVRVQVASRALRGPVGTLFTKGGTSPGGERWIPDQEIRFDVTPRNLNLGR